MRESSWQPLVVLPTHCVDRDRWDLESLHAMVKSMRALARARTELGRAVATGTDALDDAFWLLRKAVPRLVAAGGVRASHQVNRTVAAELARLSSLRRLRLHTVGDSVAAASACVELRPALEAIFDRLDLEQAMANELQALMEHIGQLGQAVADAEDRFDAVDVDEIDELGTASWALGAARDELDQAEKLAKELATELAERLEDEAVMIAAELAPVVASATKRVEAEAAVAAAWGLEPGALIRMSAPERLALARTLNTPRLREIAALFGRIQNLALSDAAAAEMETPEDICDLETGGDLGRVVPAEFLLLGAGTENAFFARLADRQLLQYAMDGSEPLERGGIVMCMDGSGSMRGTRELWAKAVMLVLLHLAREQGRSMHVIHFGGPGQIRHIEFTEPEHFTPDRIIDAATTFFMSGTCFETPLAAAMDVLAAEFTATGRVRSDVVFATDGQCSVSGAFMAEYLAQMESMQARTWGVAFAGYQVGDALWTMSEGRVMSVKDLTSGRDVHALLRGTR